MTDLNRVFHNVCIKSKFPPMFTFYQQLVVQMRGKTQPSLLLQLILTSLPRPVRHFERTCTVPQTIVQFSILFLLLQFCRVLKPFGADLEMSGLEDLGPLPEGWSLKWHGVGEARRPWVVVWFVAIVVSCCYCFCPSCFVHLPFGSRNQITVIRKTWITCEAKKA